MPDRIPHIAFLCSGTLVSGKATPTDLQNVRRAFEPTKDCILLMNRLWLEHAGTKDRQTNELPHSTCGHNHSGTQPHQKEEGFGQNQRSHGISVLGGHHFPLTHMVHLTSPDAISSPQARGTLNLPCLSADIAEWRIGIVGSKGFGDREVGSHVTAGATTCKAK